MSEDKSEYKGLNEPLPIKHFITDEMQKVIQRVAKQMDAPLTAVSPNTIGEGGIDTGRHTTGYYAYLAPNKFPPNFDIEKFWEAVRDEAINEREREREQYYQRRDRAK